MPNKFREVAPSRTCTKKFGSYSQYKAFLRQDFNKRCGYTDCSDRWFGGKNNFHIDHFLPWKKFPLKPELKTAYSNLVYACSYINILKSDDLGAYLDPCDHDFNDHFERDSHGNIWTKSTSTKGQYMFFKLKLYLRRYQVIWMLEKLYQKMRELKATIDKTKDRALLNELKIAMGELGILLIDYLEYLEAEQ